MKKDLNICVISGNIANDPEMITTDSGYSVTKFQLANHNIESEKRADGQGASYFKVEAWGKMADVTARFLSKGRHVTIHGHMVQRYYVRKSDNKKINYDVLILDQIVFGAKHNERQERHGI
jgi:single-strand DNA-binding protein